MWNTRKRMIAYITYYCCHFVCFFSNKYRYINYKKRIINVKLLYIHI